MLAAVRNLSRCLLVFLALGVVSGQFHQLECRLDGCKAAVTANAGDNDSSAPADHSHCSCQCHCSVLAAEPLLAGYKVYIRAWSDFAALEIDHAPEAPCADIEHPPQVLRA